MTEAELRALIAQGEGQRVEFKAAEADAADLARAVAALANSGGGTLLLGVGDDGSILGLWYAQPPHITRNIRTLPDVAAWRQFVVNLSRHNCEPAVPIALEHVAVDGRDVLAVHVPDGQDKSYRANGRVYVRVDADVHEATREEVARLMVESGRVQHERLPVLDAELSELDDALLREREGAARSELYGGSRCSDVPVATTVTPRSRAPARPPPALAEPGGSFSGPLQEVSGGAMLRGEVA